MTDNIYFVGIGGIGMSALARFFMRKGIAVAGYDLTETPLTRALEAEGADVHYTDNVEMIPQRFRDRNSTLVVYTPAIPADHSEMAWFRAEGFEIEKRSEMLGRLAEGHFTMAVAGTHGKTTTTTLVAWLNHVAGGGGSAFLGGISKNFDSNLVLGPGRRLAVEADEFDRSFLRLSPDVAAITSVDADHLDIYGTPDAFREAFTQFVNRVERHGAVILNSKIDIDTRSCAATVYRYSLDDRNADFHTTNLKPLPDGCYSYDIVTPDGVIAQCRLGITGRINVENSVAAVAMMWAAAKMTGGTTADMGEEEFADKIRKGLAEFKGVKRRFDFWVNTPSATYMDDYAHHPEELSAALGSLREMFPGRNITAIFQPHLYTRTRDFHKEFARALSLADRVILTPIYPARETPIEGIDAETIGREIEGIPWQVVNKERVADQVAEIDTDVVVSFGAGDIDLLREDIAKAVRNKIG